MVFELQENCRKWKVRYSLQDKCRQCKLSYRRSARYSPEVW